MADHVAVWPGGSDEPHPCLPRKPGSPVTRRASCSSPSAWGALGGLLAPSLRQTWPGKVHRPTRPCTWLPVRGQHRGGHQAGEAPLQPCWACRGHLEGRTGLRVPRCFQRRTAVVPPRCRGGWKPEHAASPRPAAPAGKPWACSGEAARGGSLRAGEAGGCPGPPARLPVTLTPGVQGEGPTPVTSVALAGMTAAPLSHRQTSPRPCAGGDFKRLERQGPPLCPVLSASWPWDRPAARPGRGWAGPIEGRVACSTHVCPRCWAAALPSRRPPRACPGPQVSPRPPLVTHVALCWGHRIESLTVRPERFGPTVRSAHPAECHSPERGLPRPLRWPGACAAGPPARRTVSRILPPLLEGAAASRGPSARRGARPPGAGEQC